MSSRSGPRPSAGILPRAALALGSLGVSTSYAPRDRDTLVTRRPSAPGTWDQRRQNLGSDASKRARQRSSRSPNGRRRLHFNFTISRPGHCSLVSLSAIFGHPFSHPPPFLSSPHPPSSADPVCVAVCHIPELSVLANPDLNPDPRPPAILQLPPGSSTTLLSISPPILLRVRALTAVLRPAVGPV